MRFERMNSSSPTQSHREQPLPHSVRLEVSGEALVLDPDKAVWWENQAVLFIADTHWGKSGAFRSLGVAVPEPCLEDLARLDRLCRRYQPRCLVVLGDLFHARRGISSGLLDSLHDWRARHPSMRVQVVRGNHDRAAGDPPSHLEMEMLAETWQLDGFYGTHHPSVVPESRLTLAGHLHPGWTLSDRSGARLRAPCFWLSGRQLVLPAFGSFTGLEIIRPCRGDRVFMVGPSMVLEIPVPGDGGKTIR